jgi:hypothetical protein
MKTISTFLTALVCAFLTFSVNAQTIVQDTAWGGQMIYVAQAKVIIPDSTTVQVRTMWDFNSNFNNFTASAWKTYTNNSATADTVFTTDTMQMPMTGIFSVRYEVQKVGDTTSYFSGPKPVTVRAGGYQPNNHSEHQFS